MRQGIESLPFEVQQEKMVPSGGINGYTKAADMLADFGRHGDVYVIHAAEGENVIPMKVLDANPRMKKMIYKQMEDMGLEPEQYIVGNELNSVNPVTGIREFGWFSKIFRSVKKFIKKAAPIVLPIAAPFLFPLMPVALAAGLGSFAGNLIGGSDIKSSFKKALFSAALAGVGNVAFGNMASGASNPFGSNFGQGFGSGTFFGSSMNPTAGLGNFSFSDAFTPSFSGNFANTASAYRTNTGMANPQLGGTGAQGGSTQIQPNNAPGSQGNTVSMADIGNDAAALSGDVSTNMNPYNQLGKPPGSQPNLFEKYVYNNAPNTGVNQAPDSFIPVREGEGYLESIFSPNRSSIDPFSPDNLAKISQDSGAITANIAKLSDAGVSPDLIKNMTDSATKSIYAKGLTPASTFKEYLPAAVGATTLAGGAGYAAGAFDAPKPGPDENGDGMPDYYITGQDLWNQDPNKYGFGTDNFYGNNPYYQSPNYMPVTVAGGGHIAGAGTSTSDSIPAMLSDGEFVMNAKAVRGAGGGNREDGARRMYAMMRKFENGAV